MVNRLALSRRPLPLHPEALAVLHEVLNILSYSSLHTVPLYMR